MSLHRHRLLVAAVLLFLSLPVFAAETAGPRIYLPEQRHDLGSVKEGDRPEYAFEIKNTGNELLLIKRIKPS